MTEKIQSKAVCFRLIGVLFEFAFGRSAVDAKREEEAKEEENIWRLKMEKNVGKIASSGMLPDVDVPVLLRRSHVKSGYRPLNRSLRYYLRSAFLWHNELVNVWTHALPLIGIFAFYLKPEWESERPRASVLFAYSGVAILFLCSAMTHLMHSRSALDHIFWLLVDFSGIAIFGLSVGVTRFSCREESSPLFVSFYIPSLVLVLLAQYLSTCCLFVSFPFWPKRHLIRIITCGLVAIWMYIPLYDRYWTHYSLAEDASLLVHNRAFQWLLLAGIFMGSSFPECYAPGRFDLIGYGHQLFHLCILMVTFYACEAAHSDCRENGNGNVWTDPLVIPLLWVSFLALLICSLTIVFSLRVARHKLR